MASILGNIGNLGGLTQKETPVANVAENSIQQTARALQRLIKDSTKKHTALRTSCQTALDYMGELQSLAQSHSIIVDDNGLPLDPVFVNKLANKLISPLKLACESRVTKLMVPALDTLQKLMAYKYFRGDAIDEESPDRKLMAKVISTIGSCFDYPDDGVQLQIIKAFFTAVTEPVCDVHESLLMNAIRTIYNIYLVSRNPVNQSTAKGTLTQMLHNIFQRMEAKLSPESVFGIDETFDEEELDKTIPSEVGTPRPRKESVLSTTTTETAPTTEHNNGEHKEQKELLAQSPEQIEEFARKLVIDLLPKDQDLNNNNNNNTKSSTTIPPAGTVPAKADEAIVFTDCFVIFRALCKLSTKEIPKDASEVNSIDMKSKILSLELLHTILENSGPVFRSFTKFINTAIKKYLVMSLLTNGVSSNPKVFKYSLSIFLILVSHFKDYLKNEIGVFYSEIFFLILESQLSTLQQKWMVLQVLLQICRNPQALVETFVNYDCGLEGQDVYERMVNSLSKIVQGKHVVDTSNVTLQEIKLKKLGLECMVTIVRSLVDWSKDLRKDFEKAESSDNKDKEKDKEKEQELEKEEVKIHKPPSAVLQGGKQLDADHPDFHEVKQYKLALVQRISKFNLSPKKGMKQLIEEGFVENTPDSVARFLRTTEGIDKAKLGEYIGEKDEFNKQVMHAYIDAFTFKDMQIDIALRRLLGSFRIPGEAQKIDRIMEKYAERYFADNPSSFTNADTVYVLSFAIIMLATDLHNPAIKEKDKMRKETWIPMQIKNFEGKVDKQILSDIFDRIAAQKLTLQGEEGHLTVDGNVLADPKQRKSMFQQEVEKTILKSKQLLKEKGKDQTVYYQAQQLEHSKPMFEIACFPMLAAFSICLEDGDDPEVIELCLDGFKNAIRVSCTFFMETERNTFVTSLARFTFLNNLREMKPKNIESIKALLEIALTEANYLQDCWLPVLRSISQLEQLHVVGSGAAADFISEEEIQLRSNDKKGFRSSFIQFKTFQETNAPMIADQIDASLIDRIFTNSAQLNSNAIEDFVKCLCQVSTEEIDSPSPRMFSLQKLVELAHFNMNRIRLVWSRIWNVLADHFIKVGCEQNLRISMYAVDSLKQLAMKFLEKNEMANYHFQKEFLKPFEVLAARNTNVVIRDMVIRCLSNMIHSRATNIKSGWKSIFAVFGVAASDHDESIVRLAFSQLQEVIEKYFTLIADSFFVDCVNALVSYGNGVLFIDTSLKSISLVSFCARQLAEGNVSPIIKQENSTIAFTDNDKHLSLWFPILTGLSGIVSHSHVDVRTSALSNLFKILNAYGNMFSPALWELIFKGVLLPIFDNVKYFGGSEVLQEDNEWLTTTCFGAVNSLINLFSNFFSDISFLLNELLNLLSGMILQDNESVARIGATCFLQLVMTNGPNLSDDMWHLVCSRLSSILQSNTPAELFRVLENTESVNNNNNNNNASSAPPSRSSSLAEISTPPKTRDTNKTHQSSSAPDVVHSNSTPSRSPSGSQRGSLDNSSHKTTVRTSQSTTDLHKVVTPASLDKRTKITQDPMLSTLRILKGKSTVRLGLIETLNEIAFTHYSNLSTAHLTTLLDSLEGCYQFSLIVNENTLLVNKIAKTGLLDLLLRIEITAISCYLRVLFRMYAEKVKDSEQRVELAEGRLINRCKEIVKEFYSKSIDKHSSQQDLKRMVVGYTQIIVQILKGLGDLYDDQLMKHMGSFYPILGDLILCESLDIRQAVRALLMRIGKMKEIY